VLAQEKTPHTDSISKNILLREVMVAHRHGITELNQLQQKASGQTSTDKLLQRVPGVQMVRRGNYAWEPTIRSLNAGQINMTIDGMHIFGACTDRMDPVSSYVEPNNLHKITTDFNTGIENYGGGIGGGINFKLREAKTSTVETLKGSMGTGYETNAQAIQTLGSLSYSAQKFAVEANGIFRKSSDYLAAGNTEVLFSQYQKWNAALSARYQINHHHAISADYIQDEGKDIGYPALTMDVAFANAKIASLTHHYHSGHDELSHIKTKIYYNSIDHAMDDTKRPPEQVAMHMDMPGKSWTGGFYSEAMYQASNKHQLNTRLSGYLNRLTADMTMYPAQGSPMYMYTIPDAQRTFLSLDISDKMYFSPRFSLTAHTTVSYNNSLLYSDAGKEQLSGMIDGSSTQNNLLWNVGLGAVLQFSPQWQFGANVARTSRSASLQEYYAFYIFNRLDGFDYLGNAGLNQESSLNSSLNVVYSQDWLRIEATGFSYFFADYIAGTILPNYQVMTIGAKGVKQYQNIGRAKLYGGEAALRISKGDFAAFSSVNTYTCGVDNDSFSLPLISPFVSVNTLYANYKGYQAEVELETAAAQRKVSLERYGETATPSASILNLGMRKTYTFGKSELLVAFRVENLLDTYYYRHLDIMKIARPGRNFITNLTVRF